MIDFPCYVLDPYQLPVLRLTSRETQGMTRQAWSSRPHNHDIDHVHFEALFDRTGVQPTPRSADVILLAYQLRYSASFPGSNSNARRIVGSQPYVSAALSCWNARMTTSLAVPALEAPRGNGTCAGGCGQRSDVSTPDSLSAISAGDCEPCTFGQEHH